MIYVQGFFREKHLNLLSHGDVLFLRNPGTIIRYRAPQILRHNPVVRRIFQGTNTCNCWRPKPWGLAEV